MKSPDEPRRENEVLRDHISKLSAATLRISASLDISTVLREAVGSACALTGARYGDRQCPHAPGRVAGPTATVLSASPAPDPGEILQLFRIIDKQADHMRGLINDLLDVMLTGTDGIELMERVPEMADLPIISISGYRRDEMIARALEAGAADYMVKPFSSTELVARVRAVLRRQDEPPEHFRSGDLAIQYEKRQVTLADHPVNLTAAEYELLRALSVNAGQVTNYDSLLRQVWGRKEPNDIRPVRTFVKKLRRKLGDKGANPSCIIAGTHAANGTGYVGFFLRWNSCVVVE